jgi:hypothetical protein
MARIAFLKKVSILIDCLPHVIFLHEPESNHQKHLLIGISCRYAPIRLKLPLLAVRLTF